MTSSRVLKIFNALEKLYPNPTTELEYETSFQLLVAVVLSAQATDKGVNKATKNFFRTIREPKDLAALSIEQIESFIKTIGLYKSKAQYLKTLSEQLLTHYQSEIPQQLEELVKLSGVGRKTANVILNTLYKHPVIAVDTHVFRLAHRLGLSKGKTPFDVELDLMDEIPSTHLLNAHHYLILHGRYVCKSRNPLCADCSLRDFCPYNLESL